MKDAEKARMSIDSSELEQLRTGLNDAARKRDERRAEVDRRISALEAAVFRLEEGNLRSSAQKARRQKERADYLAAALACLWHSPPDKRTAKGLAEKMQEMSHMWAPDGIPPIDADTGAEHVSKSLRIWGSRLNSGT